MVTCPNCDTRNSTDNAYCAKCGFRLPTAAARGAGIAYRRAEQAEPHGGGGQGLLAFGAVLLAGMLFAVGAVALFVSAPPAASPSPISVADATPTSSLEIFIQPTPTPTVPPTPSPVPSFVLSSATPVLPSPLDTPIVGPTLTPTITPTPTPRPSRTPRPTPTSTPTPGPTQVNCAAADGSNMKTIFLGSGNRESVGPIGRAWCIHRAIFRPFLAEPGRTRLLLDGRRIGVDRCSAGECDPENTRSYSPPRLAPSGSTLAWEFTCIDNPGTPEVDECSDAVEGGSTIQLDYEPVPGS